MNTYSSVKSLDSQIYGRKMQEPSIAVTFSRHQQSPKYNSPEPNLDQIVNLKSQDLQKTLKRKKLTQGLQGKPKPQAQQTKKPIQQSVSVKKQTKRTVSPKKKKPQTVDTKKTTKQIKPTPQQRRQELGLGLLNEKQIKQRIKKLKQKDKSEEPQIRKKAYQPNFEIQSYMTQKKAIDDNNSMEKQLIDLLNKKKKLENLAKLDESVKEIFKKCKTIESSQPQTPKVIGKKKKIFQDEQQRDGRDKNLKNAKGKKNQLKQQFKDISQRFEKMQQNKQQNHFGQQIQELSNDESRDCSYIDENTIDQEILLTLKQFPPTKYLMEKINKILQQPSDIDPQQLTEYDHLILQYHFMNEAATKIQSLWKGVSIRKQLLLELQEILDQQQQEEFDQENDNSNNNDQNTDYGKEPSEGQQLDDYEVEFYDKQNEPVQAPKNTYYFQNENQEIFDPKNLKQKIQNQNKLHNTEQKKDSPQNQIIKIQQNSASPKQNKIQQEQKKFEQPVGLSNKKKSSEQTDDLVIIQQPNSPVNQQELYFYNPFMQNNQQQQSLEKQIHYSNIKSSVASEDDQKSALSQSVIQQIQQELELWNSQIESIFKQAPEKQAFANVKQQMSQTILNIVSQHMKKQKDVKNHERKDSEQSVDQRLRNLQEANNERTFNDARKRLLKNHEQSDEKLQSSQKEINDGNRSSLISLQSQLIRKESELLHMREEAINLRYKAELKKGKSDPTKKQELDNWLEKEQEDLKNTKQAIEVSRKREAKAIQKIQRDLLIAQTFDENNPKLQSLKKQVDEQFSQNSILKSQKLNGSDIKIINHFDADFNEDLDKIPDTYSEDLQVEQNQDQRNIMRENIIESDKQIETYQTISVVTNDILNDIIQNLAEEILQQKDNFEYIISGLISQSIIPQLPISIRDIRLYITNFFNFILQTHENDIIRNLNIAYGFTPFKRMQLIHGYDNDNDDNEEEFHAQEEREIQIAFPLEEGLFLEYEQHRLQQEQQNEQQDALKELEHIHNKAVFDSCNEALNYFRPNFLNSGLPYPWENRPAPNQITKYDLKEILKRMEDKVINWSGTLAGFLPVEDDNQISQEKQEILDEKNQQIMLQQLHQLENPLLFDSQISQQMNDHISQIRDERLYKMLISDIKESEYKWYLVEDDKAEFLMELSDIIFEQLVEEMASEQLQQ